MTDSYHPFSDPAALVDPPVSRRGSSMPLFTAPEDRPLVQAATRPAEHSRLASADSAEAAEDTASSDET